MRKSLLIAVLFAGGCIDSNNSSIEIPFDLFASDELTSSPSGVCGFAPVTQASGVYKESGTLELDPVLNANPEYVLGLQVENYLDSTTFTDSNGNVVLGPQRNDFHVEKAVINYVDIEGGLTNVGAKSVLVSGDVRVGGSQNASSVVVSAVPPAVAQSWQSDFNANGIATEDVVIEVQLVGVLGSGETTQSGTFNFPITLCWGCGGIALGSDGKTPSCGNGETPIAEGHGPCCASQDFFDACVPCGAAGQPCCAGTSTTPPSCDSTPTALVCGGASTTSGEICPFPNEETQVCATAS